MIDAAAMSLSELADHIERTHHAYLRVELSRLGKLVETAASVDGDKDPRVLGVRDTFRALAAVLSSHMMKEEQILFPMVRQLDTSDEAPMFHCGTLANPIHQMEFEHDQVGSTFTRLRELTDGFTAPEWASEDYRVLLDALADIEHDTHAHTQKESEVLFPRAIEMEQRKGTS